MHQIRFWLGHWGNLQLSPDPLVGGEGTGCPSQESSQCRETVKYVLIKSHCTSKNAHSFVHRRSSSHRDPLSLQRYERYPTTTWTKGPKVKGPPSQGRVGPPNF